MFQYVFWNATWTYHEKLQISNNNNVSKKKHFGAYLYEGFLGIIEEAIVEEK